MPFLLADPLGGPPKDKVGGGNLWGLEDKVVVVVVAVAGFNRQERTRGRYELSEYVVVVAAPPVLIRGRFFSGYTPPLLITARELVTVVVVVLVTLVWFSMLQPLLMLPLLLLLLLPGLANGAFDVLSVCNLGGVMLGDAVTDHT